MGVVLTKWGNSVGVRLPANVLQSTGLRANDEVNIREEGGRIVLEPVRRKYDLATLLEGVTPENAHYDDVDFERPVGKEVW